MLESDLSYARFLLDGQTMVLDDYLEIRPEAEAALRASRRAAGSPSGPWMVLMDEFMVSGETIVRDLQLGMARGARVRRRDAGRLPARHVRPRRADAADPAARRPRARGRLARRAARGRRRPRSGGRRPTARACAPNTSTARTRTDATCPTTPSSSCGRAATTKPSSAPSRLGRHAADERHRPSDAAAVARPRRRRSERRSRTTTSSSSPRSPSTSRRSRSRGSATWKGELRSGARANVLMGVASNRVDIHRACAAGRARDRDAGRTARARCSCRPTRTRTRSLDLAWRQPRAQQRARLVVRVQRRRGRRPGARCGTPRRASSATGSRATRSRDLAAAGRRAGRRDDRREPDRAPAGGLVEVSMPGARPGARGRPTTARQLPGAGARPRRGGVAFSDVVIGSKVRWVLDLMRGVEFAGNRRRRGDDRAGRRRCLGRRAAHRDARAMRSPTSASYASDAEARRRGRHVARQGLPAAAAGALLFDAGRVAGFGWATLTRRRGRRPDGAVHGTGTRRSHNEHLDVEIDADTGTYSVDHARRRDRDAVSAGSSTVATAATPTTTRRPPTDTRSRHARLRAVDDAGVRAGARPRRDRHRLRVAARTPKATNASCTRALRATVPVDGAHHARAAPRRALRAGPHRARQPVRTTTGCARTSRCPRPCRGSDAECAFAVVHRGLTAEGGALEYGLPTFVSRRFVDASDGAVGLALAARRAARVRGRRRRHASWRSRCCARSATSRGANRRCGRIRPGPSIPVRGAQLHGPQRVRLRGAPPPRRLAHGRAATPQPTRSSSRSSGRALGGVERAPARDAVRRSRSTAPRSRPCTRDAGRPRRAGVPHRARRRATSPSTTGRCPRAAGSSTCAARRVAAFEGSVTLRPWEIVTLRLS